MEEKTITTMITLFCRRRHGRRDGLCPQCRELLDYALARLAKCPFEQNKPSCGRCPVHCYRPDMRVKIKAVMRYAGPRMIYRHPILTLTHMLNR